jgi:hypothetical protein
MKLIFGIFICLLSISCSVTKRQHLSGFHSRWHNNSFEVISNQYFNESSDLSSDLNSTFEPNFLTTLSNTSQISPSSICDSIFLSDGTIILAIVKRVEAKTIEYTKCGEESTFLHKIYKSTIKSIKYGNGSVIKKETSEEKEIRENKLIVSKKIAEQKFKEKYETEETILLEKEKKERNIKKNFLILLFFLMVTYSIVFWLAIQSFKRSS